MLKCNLLRTLTNANTIKHTLRGFFISLAGHV